MASGFDFDLVCIGSGPAGQRAAVRAAKLGKRVALIERQRMVGGACCDTGTIPSKTFGRVPVDECFCTAVPHIFAAGDDYFLDAIFNYPTLAECYEVAALDAANKLAL